MILILTLFIMVVCSQLGWQWGTFNTQNMSITFGIPTTQSCSDLLSNQSQCITDNGCGVLPDPWLTWDCPLSNPTAEAITETV